MMTNYMSEQKRSKVPIEDGEARTQGETHGEMVENGMRRGDIGGIEEEKRTLY
jgi:hypothetical protein